MGLVLPRLYAIIDPAQTGGRPAIGICRELLAAGITLIQYRDKRSSTLAILEACREFAREIRQQGGMFFANDRADIALAAGAHGVHVGQEDLPVELARRVIGSGCWVGVSTHHLDQVREADTTSADYIAFGPIFETRSKENPDAVVGLAGLREARKATEKPLVAIGGLKVENARAVIDAGADSVAVISDLVGASNIGARVHDFMMVLEQG